MLGEHYRAKKKKQAMYREDIQRIIEDMQDAKQRKQRGERLTRMQYHYMPTYDILQISDDRFLIKKPRNDREIQYVVAYEDFFDVLQVHHKKTGHGGRDKMLHSLKMKQLVPRTAVNAFVKACAVCEAKATIGKKGLIVRPITSKDFNSRGQVDLIDLQSASDGNFKWLMNYQDHATKFVFLRPLQSKRAAEVAMELLKIFLEVGAPRILQSDNDMVCRCRY